jgi:uncharacterized protein (UPF0335 family)
MNPPNVPAQNSDADHGTERGTIRDVVEHIERLTVETNAMVRAMTQQSYHSTAARKAAAAQADTDKGVGPVQRRTTAAMNTEASGVVTVGGLKTFLETIEALASAGELDSGAMRKRLETIRRVAQLAVQFASGGS